ncbi:MAG: hypothetical protein AB1941_21875 [Gemmatimonadota bacterium]
MITDLNDVPDSLLRQARALADSGRIRAFLMRRTAPESWEYLEAFIEDVVLGSESAAGWRRGQVLVPDFSLADQLRLAPADLLAPLGGGFAHRVKPSLEDWRSGAAWVGAPALLLPSADYRFAVPDRAVGLGAAETEAVRDREVALRRWIAARLARAAEAGSAPESLESLVARSPWLPALDEWSRDAAIAGGGLLREHGEIGGGGGGIPGMRGPDDWYRG